jgi:hypothetical protein
VFPFAASCPYLCLWPFGALSAPYQGQVVVSTQHLRASNTGIEVWQVLTNKCVERPWRVQPRDTLISHGSELNTASKRQGYAHLPVLISDSPQNPESRPTAKQLASLLKEAESETGPADSSITGLVFMAGAIESVIHTWGNTQRKNTNAITTLPFRETRSIYCCCPTAVDARAAWRGGQFGGGICMSPEI